jgi:PIN domain
VRDEVVVSPHVPDHFGPRSIDRASCDDSQPPEASFMKDTSDPLPVRAGVLAASSPVHVLVDLENNQPTLEQVKALVPDMTDVWLFHSGKHSKHLDGFASLGARQMAVPISRPGKNSLDFHLSFYLGYLAARNPGTRLIVMAIDGGYAPMIEHAVKTLGFDVDRVSLEPPAAKKKASKKAAKPTLKTTKKAAKKVPVATGAKKRAPAAKKAARKKPAAKTSPVKSVAKKTAAAAKKVVAIAAEDQQIDRLIMGLRKMGAKAPARAKTYRQHLKSMLGKDAKDDAVEAAAAALAARGVATIDGNAIKYDFASASGG